MNPTIYFVKGKNCIGKTQWMLLNIGCYPDLNFPDKFSMRPLDGIMTKLLLFPDPYQFPIFIYTDAFTELEEKQDLRTVLENKPSKIFIQCVSHERYIPLFRELAHFNVKELYLNDMNYLSFQYHLTHEEQYVDFMYNTHNIEKINLSPSLERIFFEIRTDQPLEIVDCEGKGFQSENTLSSSYQRIIPELNAKILKLSKKISTLKTQKIKYETLESQVHPLKINLSQLKKDQSLIEENLDSIRQFQNDQIGNTLIEKEEYTVDQSLQRFNQHPLSASFEHEFIINNIALFQNQLKIQQTKEELSPLEKKLTHKPNQTQIAEIEQEINELTAQLIKWKTYFPKIID